MHAHRIFWCPREHQKWKTAWFFLQICEDCLHFLYILPNVLHCWMNIAREDCHESLKWCGTSTPGWYVWSMTKELRCLSCSSTSLTTLKILTVKQYIVHRDTYHKWQALTSVFFLFAFIGIFHFADVLFGILQNKSLEVQFCLARFADFCQSLKDEWGDMEAIGQPSVARERPDPCTHYRELHTAVINSILTQIKNRFEDCCLLSQAWMRTTEHSSTLPDSALASISIEKELHYLQIMCECYILLYLRETYCFA